MPVKTLISCFSDNRNVTAGCVEFPNIGISDPTKTPKSRNSHKEFWRKQPVDLHCSRNGGESSEASLVLIYRIVTFDHFLSQNLQNFRNSQNFWNSEISIFSQNFPKISKMLEELKISEKLEIRRKQHNIEKKWLRKNQAQKLRLHFEFDILRFSVNFEILNFQ